MSESAQHPSSVAVLGAGSWGTALAKHLADGGHRVNLWARRETHAHALDALRENEIYLPGVVLPPGIRVTNHLREALRDAKLVVWVVPSHYLRGLLEAALPSLSPRSLHVSCTKGIENGSLLMMSELFAEHLGSSAATSFSVLGGPSFAKEVAASMPTAVCVASRSEATAIQVQRHFATDRFRVYTTDDVVGVELGGALKNVIAIAAGFVQGVGLGSNSLAALMTRGLAEMSRLAIKLGAHPLTLSGLSGVGDLVLTCTGDLSRNRRVGLELGRGHRLDDILQTTTMVAEGVRTARSVHDLSRREGVEMPIFQQVYEVLYEHKSAEEAVQTLMNRALRAERD